MDRAERRRRRMLKIRWRQRLFFTAAGYDWDRDHIWWTEDGRLAKYNTACGCLGCRGWRWENYSPYDLHAGDLEGYDRVFAKHNRTFRSPLHPLLRRGPKGGTTIWKGKLRGV
jgi:hypothetical protein